MPSSTRVRRRRPNPPSDEPASHDTTHHLSMASSLPTHFSPCFSLARPFLDSRREKQTLRATSILALPLLDLLRSTSCSPTLIRRRHVVFNTLAFSLSARAGRSGRQGTTGSNGLDSQAIRRQKSIRDSVEPQLAARLRLTSSTTHRREEAEAWAAAYISTHADLHPAAARSFRHSHPPLPLPTFPLPLLDKLFSPRSHSR